MTASVLEVLGLLAACAGAAVALIAREPRLRYGAATVAVIAAPALVAGDVWDSSRFVDLRGHPVTLAAAIAAALLAVGVAASHSPAFRGRSPSRCSPSCRFEYLFTSVGRPLTCWSPCTW